MIQVHPAERTRVLLSAAFFFFILGGYYVLRPLRDEMGVQGGGDRLSLLFLGTLTGTLLLNPLLGWLISRFPRVVFVPVVYRVIAGSLVLFYLALRFGPAHAHQKVAAAFFVWVSVFVMFLTSLFWGVMVDVWRSEQGKRLFGLIGVGGTAGGIAGAALTAGLVKRVGPENMILAAVLLLELGVQCVRRLVKGVDPAASRTEPAEDEEPPGHGAWHGLKLILGSRYLLALCLFLLFFTVSSTFLYFEQARIVRAAFTSPAERTAFFARMDLTVNVATVLIQVLLTAPMIRLLGVGGTLTLLPLVTVAGFAALWRMPAVGVLFVVQSARRAVEFSLIRPSRELLFTVVSREEKYASKAFIDTFVYRGGDAVGALSDIALKALQAGEGITLLLFLPIGAAWAVLSAWLGRQQARRAAERVAGDLAEAIPAAPSRT